MQNRRTDRACRAVIVVPTMHLEGAAKVAFLARRMAGVECGVLIASDMKKRGAVVVGNVLMQAAMDWGAEYIAYLNDDVDKLPQNWLADLIDVMDSNPKYSNVSATGKCRGGPQAKGKPSDEFEVVETKHPLAWFCTVIRADALLQVGLFNESLIHYADDSEWSYRAVAAGWINVCVRGVHVNHSQDKDPIHEWWEHDLAILRKQCGHMMK